MAATSPIMSIRNARKSYGATAALNGIHLDLWAGELLGFLGPNGAGKTTLIQCLAGRAKLDEGEIRLSEKNVKLGLVPQRLALYEDLTAQQNLMAFGQLHAVPRRELRNRVEQALEWANLEDRRHRLVKTYSGGMKRRLNIACSVLHQPQVLLLDEPTVGVDPQSRERIYEMIHGMCQQGAAVLLTTHHLDEAQHRCDRIAIVDQGTVVRLGTLDELITETIGRNQRLCVRFRQPLLAAPSGLELDETGQFATCDLDDAASELPRILQRLHAGNDPVDQVALHGPTLQRVFLHLTGKELRE